LCEQQGDGNSREQPFYEDQAGATRMLGPVHFANGTTGLSDLDTSGKYRRKEKEERGNGIVIEHDLLI
jgi:hypothetical protein